MDVMPAAQSPGGGTSHPISAGTTCSITKHLSVPASGLRTHADDDNLFATSGNTTAVRSGSKSLPGRGCRGECRRQSQRHLLCSRRTHWLPCEPSAQASPAHPWPGPGPKQNWDTCSRGDLRLWPRGIEGWGAGGPALSGRAAPMDVEFVLNIYFSRIHLGEHRGYRTQDSTRSTLASP